MRVGIVSAEIRAKGFAMVGPGVFLRAIGTALVSPWVTKLSGDILGTRGLNSHLGPLLSHLHLSHNSLKPSFWHFVPKGDS